MGFRQVQWMQSSATHHMGRHETDGIPYCRSRPFGGSTKGLSRMVEIQPRLEQDTAFGIPQCTQDASAIARGHLRLLSKATRLSSDNDKGGEKGQCGFIQEKLRKDNKLRKPWS